LTAVVAALCATPPAFAAEPFQRDDTPLPAGVTGAVAEQGTEQAASGGGGGGVVRMIVGLLVVLAVIYGVYWLLKAYGRSKGAQSDGKLEVVSTTALAPNRMLHLVRVGDELVLVGTGEKDVRPIRVYDATESLRLETMLHAGSPAPMRSDAAGGGPFVARFTQELRKRTARG
jgi:flagellar protein FliO/FliZ